MPPKQRTVAAVKKILLPGQGQITIFIFVKFDDLRKMTKNCPALSSMSGGVRCPWVCLGGSTKSRKFVAYPPDITLTNKNQQKSSKSEGHHPPLVTENFYQIKNVWISCEGLQWLLVRPQAPWRTLGPLTHVLERKSPSPKSVPPIKKIFGKNKPKWPIPY